MVQIDDAVQEIFEIVDMFTGIQVEEGVLESMESAIKSCVWDILVEFIEYQNENDGLDPDDQLEKFRIKHEL